MLGKKNKNKIILDTNWWISAFISKISRKKVANLVFNKKINIYYSTELINEYELVITRKKFIKIKNKFNFFEDVKPLLVEAVIDKIVKLSRDLKDDFLLSLALSINADYLITGDEDLLILEQIGLTKIITMDDFLK